MTESVASESAGSVCTGQCHCLEPRFLALDTKADNLESKVDHLEIKLDHIGVQLKETKQRVDHIDTQLQETRLQVVSIDERLKDTKQSVDQLRADNREQLRWGMAATALLFGAIVSSFLLSNAKADLITAEASKSAVALQKIADEVAAIKAMSLEQQSRQAPKP